MFPARLEEWTLDAMNDMIRFRVYENERLDFKGKKILSNHHGLEEDLCAMANSSGGFIVLGIEETRHSRGNIINYEKNGFDIGEEDNVHHLITQKAFLIDPYPEFRMKDIPDLNKFYTIIEINSNNNLKPHFTQTNDQCFVRIGESTKRASRSIILSLYSSHNVPWDLKLKHFQYIIEVLDKLAYCKMILENSKYVIEVPNNVHDYRVALVTFMDELTKKSLDAETHDIRHLNHLDWAISHLRTYGREYELWERINRSISEYNENVDSVVKLLGEYIKSHLESSFPQFRIVERPTAMDLYGSEKIVDLDAFVRFLLSHSLLNREKFSAEDLRTNINSKPDHPYIMDKRDQNDNKNNLKILNLIYEEERSSDLFVNFEDGQLDTNKLLIMIKQIVSYLKDIICDNWNLERQINQLSRTFRRQIDNLVVDLKAGEILRGTCKIGY